MNQRVRGITFFRSVYYLPAVTSGVAVALLWQFVFHKQWGILNAMLDLVGIRPVGWLVDPDWVMVAFVIMSLWGVGVMEAVAPFAVRVAEIAWPAAATITTLPVASTVPAPPASVAPLCATA